MDLAAFDWTIYWFMFPVSIVIATTAMRSGIGGAAMFAPIFMIIFPMLGPDYPFPSIAAAIGVALFTETFGFSSGFVGYFRKGLIDFKSALPFIAVGVPIGIVGAILLTSFKDFEEVLRGSYAVLMLVLAAELIRHHDPVAGTLPEETGAESAGAASVAGARPMRTITARDGTEYSFRAPRQGKGAIATGIGRFLTGLLGVGIGEVVMPQLVKRNHVPVAVAAATSVFVVIVVVARRHRSPKSRRWWPRAAYRRCPGTRLSTRFPQSSSAARSAPACKALSRSAPWNGASAICSW